MIDEEKPNIQIDFIIYTAYYGLYYIFLYIMSL